MGLNIFSKRRPASSFNEISTNATLEERTLAIGRSLLDAARANQSGLLSRAFWSDKLMNWSMKDPAFKVQLFRFVDAFPSLRDPDAVHEHLVDYLSQPGVTLPPGMSFGMAAGGLAKGLFTKTMTSQIEGMASKFIAGTDASDAVKQLQKLWKRRIAFSVDLLGEACVSEVEAAAYRARYLDLVEVLAREASNWPKDELLETDHLGAIPRVNVSIKISSLSAKTDPIDFEGALERSISAILPILESAKKLGVLVNFDMEHHALKDFTLELFERCCERVNFHAGLAMQAYLKSGDADAKRIIDWSKRIGKTVTVRLVKGAYWDFETIHAEQQGWHVPVWPTKPETDACFERMAKLFVDAMPTRPGEAGVKLALGSHNLRSIAATLAMLDARGLPKSAIELQMLHGMADALKEMAIDQGLRLREYVPVGQMLPGMAYLVRRLLENTSNESWLRAGFSDDADAEVLLKNPAASKSVRKSIDDENAQRALKHRLSDNPTDVGEGRPFFTEPMRDFSDARQRDAFARAITSSRLVEVKIDATVQDAQNAIERASKFFPTWRDTDPRMRAKCLTEAARLMRQRRDELSAIIIKENGKNWRNADADVCEAIDFCDYYARESIKLFEFNRLGKFTGELNQLVHQPLGVCAVISPWNFPLAISCGMVVAALVTGNTTILKPAEQTPVIAKVLVDLLHQAGVPKEALIFVPGVGETVGAALVRDPRVASIAFTGSKEVGQTILREAVMNPPEGRLSKRVICETGGKNAIIIDLSADLDETVLGVRDSAFGFSGQKCSACSRAIVVEGAYETFLERLIESTRSLIVDDPTKPGTDLGPVIDDEAAKKIRWYIELAKSEGKIELAMMRDDLGSRFIGPHIVTNLSPTSRVASEEIFGPILSVLKARDFDHALELANASPFKLTGAVYSRKPSNIEKARQQFRVGNLYLNRGSTGALVGRQPFGGFGFSGIGSKAGGPEYLLQFVEPRAITENTMRRGFAPETSESGV